MSESPYKAPTSQVEIVPPLPALSRNQRLRCFSIASLSSFVLLTIIVVRSILIANDRAIDYPYLAFLLLLAAVDSVLTGIAAFLAARVLRADLLAMAFGGAFGFSIAVLFVKFVA